MNADASDARLPCVCCGRSLLLTGKPARDPSEAAAVVTHSGPLFVCAVCYASAYSIATELEGTPLEDPDDMHGANNKLAERHAIVVRDTLFGMARLGWLGQHAKDEP